ncbi:MAG: serine--tRNA ligase [Planctomycetota bacterium]|nr:MAG: serine--tRNA ligase [Planctomycetota bacterium]
MIDINALREDPQAFADAWAARGEQVDVAVIEQYDATVRRLKAESEAKKAEANEASKAIGAAARAGADVSEAKAHARALGDAAKALDGQRAQAEETLRDYLLHLPNVCLADVPEGADADANVERSRHGTAPALDFTPKPHWDLATDLGIIDFARGANLAGSGFVVYRGDGARLQRALVSYFLDCHRLNGYEEIAPPFLVRPEIMQGTGQLPKFADQLYATAEDDLLLIPTAEVPVTNLHAGEILERAALPKRYCAHTPCFRREAGAAGVGTRGITRVHQFEKVEMVWITSAEDSVAALETMRGHAEALLKALDLHWRVLDLCTGDIGFSAARTYDLEVWSTGTQQWLEVSSLSNCTDFQARRMGLRYRPEAKAKPVMAHTLNGSGLALPRCMIAVLERWQQADGSVLIPEVLRPYMGGQDRITATNAPN